MYEFVYLKQMAKYVLEEFLDDEIILEDDAMMRWKYVTNMKNYSKNYGRKQYWNGSRYMWHDQGNESLVKNVNSHFLTPLSHTYKMLYFDANPITIEDLVTELWRICQC